MAYTLAPFNPSTPYQNQVATELNTANTNFTILGQAFYNNDPTSQPILRASYTGSSAPSNPVAGMTWLDTSSNPPTLKVYDGSNWQSNVVNATNSTNAVKSANSDKVNNFPASLTPAPNTIVPLNSNGILDLSTTYVKSNVYTFRRVDLSSASSDYMLQVGEEAILNFNNASSVPLYISTQNGTYYELSVVLSNSSGNTSPIYLNPNNTTYSSAFKYESIYLTFNGSSASVESNNLNAFRIGGIVGDIKCYIINYTTHKSMLGICTDIGGSSSPVIHTFSNLWNDTSTAWTSLGTITFPQSSTGYILVRRLA